MSLSSRKPIKVRRVGSSLVASFASSRPPMVWTFDLKRHHSFAVVLEGEDGDCELGVTSPNGEFFSIARFAAREDGEAALGAVRKVLLRRPRRWLWLSGLFLTLVVGAILAVLGAAAYVTLHAFAPSASAARPAAAAPPPAFGVPLPANQVLKPPN
ncbi:MAG TPA: hypothetical protein VMV79_06460 [Alphaproteobacteria bacterium]|nr:hypothetical protein [Alphaproteobacteria bacterium]